MKRSLSIVTLVIALIALVLSAAGLYCALKPVSGTVETAVEAVEESKAADVQYVLYLGTNDKDTDEPVCTPEEARERAKAILIERFGGYTIQEAEGGWIGDDGTIYQEYTLVIYLSDTTLDKVHEACDALIAAFHQSSILIQTNETTTEFYSTRTD